MPPVREHPPLPLFFDETKASVQVVRAAVLIPNSSPLCRVAMQRARRYSTNTDTRRSSRYIFSGSLLRLNRYLVLFCNHKLDVSDERFV